MKSLVFVVLSLLACLSLLSCSIEEEAEEKTTKTFDFDYEFDPLVLSSVELICTPLPAVETILAQQEEWNEIKDRIKEVRIKAVQYKVPYNTTPIDGKVKLYGGADEGSVSTDPWGETSNISANTTYPNYQNASLTEYGKNRFEEYANERDINMVICGRFSPENSEVNLTLQIKLIVEVKASAL